MAFPGLVIPAAVPIGSIVAATPFPFSGIISSEDAQRRRSEIVFQPHLSKCPSTCCTPFGSPAFRYLLTARLAVVPICASFVGTSFATMLASNTVCVSSPSTIEMGSIMPEMADVVDGVRASRSLRRSSAACPSCVCPAGRQIFIGNPFASTTAWILVVRAPRLRPRQLSGFPFNVAQCWCALIDVLSII